MGWLGAACLVGRVERWWVDWAWGFPGDGAGFGGGRWAWIGGGCRACYLEGSAHGSVSGWPRWLGAAMVGVRDASGRVVGSDLLPGVAAEAGGRGRRSVDGSEVGAATGEVA